MSLARKCSAGAAACALLLGSGCLQGPGATPVDPFKPADQALGERIFRDPRFSQWFATHATSMNALPSPGDPTVDTAVDALGPSMPGSLEEALDNLEADHDFLMKGDVFTKDAIEMWINYKRTKEVDALRLRPHPYEFFLYYDI